MIYPEWVGQNRSVLPKWLGLVQTVITLISQVPEFIRKISFKIETKIVNFKRVP